MKIVLFTEDDTTGKAIRILAQKVLMEKSKPPKVIQRWMRQGHIFNPKNVITFIRNESRQEKTKIIICVDSECTDPNIIERNLDPCKKAVKRLQFVVHFLVVVHALETWLAADEKALRSILKTNKEIKIPGNLEMECRPGNILQEVFRKHGRKFLKSKDDLIIAEHADPARIAERCSSFRRFQQILLSQ
ncbi:MAG: DUF4276 family protein [bacterium]